jgi:GNAT superfamily N-acetyltransferase
MAPARSGQGKYDQDKPEGRHNLGQEVGRIGVHDVGLIEHPVSPGIHAEIEELKVDRAHRRKGLGRALAMDALRWIENAAVWTFPDYSAWSEA